MRDLGAYTLLSMSAVVHPDYPYLLYPLLQRHTHFWLEQYPARYPLRLYAQAASERGDMLIQHLFMAPRWDLAPDAYMLDLARPSASKVIRMFQAQLKEKAPLPEELRQPAIYPIANNTAITRVNTLDTKQFFIPTTQKIIQVL